jgi:hypothetical protein
MYNDHNDDETVMVSNRSSDHANPSVDELASLPTEISLSTRDTTLRISKTPFSMPTRHAAWNAIIHNRHLQLSPQANMMFDTRRLTRAVEYAISDSGATGHFLVEGAPIVNKKVATTPVQILLPNGKRIRSTHTCNLDIPWLPNEMTEAHIVPGLSHASLISTRKFCDAGCKVSFDEEECRVFYKNKLVLIGNRDPRSQLWRLPINPPALPKMIEILRH